MISAESNSSFLVSLGENHGSYQRSILDDGREEKGGNGKRDRLM